MGEIVILTKKKAKISDEAIYELAMQSFLQWKDYGIEASYLNYSFEKFVKAIQYATTYVAIDAETGELLGTHSFTSNRKGKCAHGNWLAVSPKAKHKGIATKMLEYEEGRIRKAGFEYLRGMTAVPAVWSVNWHLKNGYRIVGYQRTPSNNHYTYVFRKQLAPSLFWSGPLAPVTARIHFLASYTVTRLCKTSTGQLTILGKIAKKIFRKK